MADLKAGDEYKARYKIDLSVRKRIFACATETNEEFYVILVGDDIEGSCDIIACIRCTYYENIDGEQTFSNKPDWVKEIAEMCTLLPTGLAVCGLCFVSKNKPAVEASSVKEIFSGADVENDLINNTQLFWLVDPTSEEKDDETIFDYNLLTNSVQISKAILEDISEDFISKHLTLRLRHRFEISVEETNDVDICMSLSEKTTQLCNRLHEATFYLPECRLLIGDGMTSLKTCQEILDDVITENEELLRQKHKNIRRSNTRAKDVLNVQLLQPMSKKGMFHKHTPVMIYQTQESSFVNFMIAVDALVMLAINCNISSLPHLFVRGIKDQLQGILACFDTYSKGRFFCIPKVFHFKTPKAPYLTTCIYPWKQSNGDIFPETNFETERSLLLKKLLLPTQRPTLHPNNNYMFPDARTKVPSGYLVNPHEGLTNPAGDGCHVAVVDGSYSYHHYMQDNFDDNKWGCAYRSLQTIFSWFRYQGYTDKKVPDHYSIQEALVTLGDKQTSFIGSKKWIGSFEVNLCLDYFLDVSSKIMAVNSGAELQSKGRELVRHFEAQGTPIMIGGGVLAHTILGVSFNDKTGETKFLILDPHYTGGEDIKIVLEKGWCGWKNHLFWNQQAHYNLCMPQRPVKV